MTLFGLVLASFALNCADGGVPAWQMAFLRPSQGSDGRVAWVGDRTPRASTSVVTNGVETTYSYRGVVLGAGADERADVFAKVVRAEDGSREWTIEATATGGWALLRVHYPILRGITRREGVKVLMPNKNLGARIVEGSRIPSLKRKTFSCPSWHPMVSAFFCGDKGLYFASHDGEARIKRICFSDDGDAYFDTPVENAGVVGKAAKGSLHTVVTAPVDGDWWSVARRYRKWALKQKWAAKGPIAKRSDSPRSLPDTDVWINIWRGDQSDLIDLVRREWKDVNAGFRWYGWNVETHDTHYPEFLAAPFAKKTFARSVKEGFLLMPYINGRLWDTELISYMYAKDDACLGRTGNVQREKFEHLCAVMCPGSARWRSALVRIGEKAVDEMGANSVYYDQVACSRPPDGFCYNPAHGHPLGGGSWWADGYREAFEKIHARLSAKGIPITSEGAAETWLDLIDGYLLTGRIAETGDVPFLTAVYSGYATYFGLYLSLNDTPEATFASQAKGVICGVVPGSLNYRSWLGASGEKPSERARRNAMLRLARLRRAGREYLGYGTFEDELRPEGRLATVEYRNTRANAWESWEPCVASYPAVIGTVWSNVEGTKRAVFAVNVSNEPQTVRFALPEKAAALAAREVAGEALPEVKCDGKRVSLSLPAFGIAFLESAK